MQGYCGSCWAFSATEQLESDSMRTLGTSYILSAEQTNQCTDYVFGGGCGGGFTESAYNYIKTSGGLVQDSDYPYTAVSVTALHCTVLYCTALYCTLLHCTVLYMYCTQQVL
jgi:C1A family cysteine protease